MAGILATAICKWVMSRGGLCPARFHRQGRRSAEGSGRLGAPGRLPQSGTGALGARRPSPPIAPGALACPFQPRGLGWRDPDTAKDFRNSASGSSAVYWSQQVTVPPAPSPRRCSGFFYPRSLPVQRRDLVQLPAREAKTVGAGGLPKLPIPAPTPWYQRRNQRPGALSGGASEPGSWLLPVPGHAHRYRLAFQRGSRDYARGSGEAFRGFSGLVQQRSLVAGTHIRIEAKM